MADQTEISAKLKALRERWGLSVRDLADLIGVPSSTYASYERAYKQPYIPMSLAKRLLKHLAGQGDPPVTQEDILRLAGLAGIPADGELDLPDGVSRGMPIKMGFEHPRPVAPDLPPEPLGTATAIAEVGVYVGMGGGGVLDLEPVNGTWQLPTEWLRQEIRGDLHQLRFLTVEGDSMAPTLDPGDKVIVDMNRRVPSPSGLFVLHDGMALVAKRLEPIGGTSPQRVRVISDNPRYQTEERLAEEIHIVGRIMARWERVG